MFSVDFDQVVWLSKLWIWFIDTKEGCVLVFFSKQSVTLREPAKYYLADFFRRGREGVSPNFEGFFWQNDFLLRDGGRGVPRSFTKFRYLFI